MNAKNTVTIVRYVSVSIMLALALVCPDVAFSQSSISFVKVTQLDTSDFPDVAIQVVIHDQDNVPVENLSPESITVTEEGMPVRFEYRAVDAGVQVALVVDAGAGSSANGATGSSRLIEIKNLIGRYIDGMGQNDLTTLIVLNESGLSVLQPMTSNKEALRGKINEISAAPNSVKLTAGLDSVMLGVQELQAVNANGASQIVIFFSSGIQRTGDTKIDDIATLSSTLDIPIHTVLVRESLTSYENMKVLSESTKGRHIYYQSEADAIALFTIVQQQRTQYLLSYRSSLGTAGDRTVQVAAKSNIPNAPRDHQTYTIDVLPGTITFTHPTAGSLLEADTANSNEATVTAQAAWPDGHPRQFVSAQLIANGTPVGAALSNPGDTMIFLIELQQYQKLGQRNVQLQIKAQDELGIEANGEPLQVMLPSSLFSDTCAGNSFFAYIFCQFYRFAGLLALLLAGGALAWVAVMYKRGYSLAQMPGVVSETIGEAWARITHTFTVSGQGELNCFLRVLDAEERMVGRVIELCAEIDTPISIGRDRSRCEVVFDGYKVISGKHCVIEYDGQAFYIQDYKSSNGTYLNDIKFAEWEKRPLEDGDQISLGPITKGGVLLSFSTAMPTPATEKADDFDISADYATTGTVEQDEIFNN